MILDVPTAMQAFRTRTGIVLGATAGVGIIMAAHWQPLMALALPLYLLSMLAPNIIRRPSLWFGVAGVWAVAAVARRHNMEDHIYLYIAWLVAIAVSLMTPQDFVDEARRHARYLISIAFGFATIWKLLSGSFVDGTALWTIGLFDDRLGPLMRVVGVSALAFDEARPRVGAMASGAVPSFTIETGVYTNLALIGIALGTIAIEALVTFSYAARDSSRLAWFRAPTLVLFGIVTYAVVPVMPFAMLLALMGITVANLDRRAVLAFTLVVLVSIARFVIITSG